MARGSYRVLKDWTDGTTTTAKVVTDNKVSLDTGNSRERVALVFRNSTKTSLIGPGQVVDGGETYRAKKATGEFRASLLHFYATSLVSSPSVSFRIYVSGNSALQADNSDLHVDWMEQIFPEYVTDDPTRLYKVAQPSSATPASNNLLAAVAGTQYRLYSYALQATGTVNAVLEDTDGTDLTMRWDLQAREGVTRTLYKYIQVPLAKGVQANLSAAVATNIELEYRKHPLVLTAAAEGCILLPQAEAVAVELINGAVATNTLTFHIQHVGLT